MASVPESAEFAKWSATQIIDWLGRCGYTKGTEIIAARGMIGRHVLDCNSYEEFESFYEIRAEERIFAKQFWKDVARIKRSQAHKVFKRLTMEEWKVQLRRINEPDALREIIQLGQQLLFDTLYVTHEDNRFIFDVPHGSITLGGWRESNNSAPFFHRQQAVFKLLMHSYNNYEAKRSKPMAVYLATSPGYGKTRLMVEWAIRVFHDPAIVSTFLFDPHSTAVTEARPGFKLSDVVDRTRQARQKCFALSEDQVPEFERRLQFLAQLHKCLKQQRIISFVASGYRSTKTAAEICKHVLINEIQRRFTTLEANDGELVIDVNTTPPSEWMRVLPTHKQSDLESLYAVYQLAVDSVHYTPVFKDVELTGKPITLVNVDEIQDLTCIEVSPGRNMTHMLLKELISLTDKNKPTFVMMVGLRTGPLKVLKDTTVFLLDFNLPLDPLHDEHYLAQLCSMTLQHSLHQLNTTVQSVVYTMWLKTLGIPRAIEFLFAAISKHKKELTQTTMTQAQGYSIMSTLCTDVQRYFSAFGNTLMQGALHNVKQHAWERICLEASLCIAKEPMAPICTADEWLDPTVPPATYAMLEADGVLCPFKFMSVQTSAKDYDPAPRQYTMPFYFYSETEEFQLGILAPSIELMGESSLKYSPLEPTISMIIGSANIQDNMPDKGDTLELAIAMSLWARYRLKSQPGTYISLSELVPSYPYKDHYVSLLGVIKLANEVGTQCLGEQIKHLAHLHAVIINRNKAAGPDVMVPLFTKPDPTTEEYCFDKLLCIQSYSGVSTSNKLCQLKPTSLANEVRKYKLPEIDAIFMLISPNFNPNDDAVVQEMKDIGGTGKVILSNGDDWLSPLLVLMLRLLPVKSVSPTSSPNKKRKQEQPDDSDRPQKKPNRSSIEYP